jgi:hypothetical protein
VSAPRRRLRDQFNAEQLAALSRLVESGAPITAIALASVPGLTDAQVDELLACEGDVVKEAALQRLNDEWQFVVEGGRTFVARFEDDKTMGRKHLVRFSTPDFCKIYGATYVGRDRKPLGDAWLAWPGRKQYAAVVFRPAGHVDAIELNLWQGWNVQPREASAEKFDRIVDYLRDVVCSGREDHFDYLVKLLARMVQRPDEAGEVITVLRGKEGTGKSTLGRLMRRIFGQHALAISSAKHLVGTFNAHLRDCVFLEASEAFFAGDKAAASALKALATDDKLFIEPKGLDGFNVKNCLHILATSNEDWVIQAGPESRRYFVLEVSNAQRGRADYWNALHQEIDDDEALGGFLHELLTLPLADFNHRDIPITAALADQREQSASGVVKWALDLASRNGVVRTQAGNQPWRGFFATRELFEDYREWLQGEKHEHHLAVNTFSRELQKKLDLRQVREARAHTPIPRHVEGVRGYEVPDTVEEFHQLARAAAGVITDDERDDQAEEVAA